MKAKSRKRLLISSVAMLLVAMLALGTATFAWFTTDTSAQAKELSVKATKASTLKISKATGDWDSIISYKTESEALSELQPISSYNGTDWYTAQAKSSNDWEQVALTGEVTEGTGKKETNIDGKLFKNQLNVRNEGEKAVTGATIKFTLPANNKDYNYVRVALVPTTAQGTNVDNNTNAFQANVYSNDGAKYNAASGVSNAKILTFTELTPKNNAGGEITVDLGDFRAADLTKTTDAEKYEAKYYNLYVWFEGQDPDCQNANAGAEVPGLVFSVSGTEAA